MFLVIGLLTARGANGAEPPQELTLQQVLRANTAALKAIRSISVTVDVSSNHPVTGEKELPTEVRPYQSIDWWKDGTHDGRDRIGSTVGGANLTSKHRMGPKATRLPRLRPQ